MKIYRVDKSDPDCHSGYSFYPTKALAAEAVRLWEAGKDGSEAVVETFDVPTTKHGLINWLNAWASHADNG